MGNPFEAVPAFKAEPTVEKEIESPRDVFRKIALARVDELAREGVFPQGYADMRKDAILLIEDNLTDPERQGIEFAEIGMEEIRTLRENVDSAEAQTVKICDDALQHIDDMWRQFQERKIVPINLHELMQSVEVTKQKIQDTLAEFQIKMEEVRTLQAGLSSMSHFDDLESSLHQLQSILEDTEK